LGEFFGILRFAQDDGKNLQRQMQMQQQQQMRGFFASLRMTAETCNATTKAKTTATAIESGGGFEN
jgi:hypothetical protein